MSELELRRKIKELENRLVLMEVISAYMMKTIDPDDEYDHDAVLESIAILMSVSQSTLNGFDADTAQKIVEKANQRMQH